MLNCFTKERGLSTVRITPVQQDNLSDWLENQTELTQTWIKTTGFLAKPQQVCLIPNAQGKINEVILGVDKQLTLESFGQLPNVLPAGIYEFAETIDKNMASLGWGMGAYVFSRYQQKNQATKPQLYIDESKLNDVETLLKSIYLIRDLINTPTEDMGPSQLAEAFQQVANELGAQCRHIIGEQLLSENYPAIHCVGRAGSQAPRLIDLTWGNEKHPKLTLVGKGVCFDTGGLDLKSSTGMLLMKKDMGGAAHVLGLAKLIIAANLPVRLRVLAPLVENAVSANAYRPGDVIRMRNGKTVEIGNTDAEGRVILADALAEASQEEPDLIIDLATLTGAARVALGPDIPIYFTPNDTLSSELMNCAEQQKEFIWRLPLHAGYRSYIDSSIADINNNASQPYAGAITAALFLQEFVPGNISWIHFDLMAWNIKNSPAHPLGGEAMALKTLFEFIKRRY